MSIVQVVLQKSALKDAQELRTAIALLENDYIAAQHKISNRIANHAQFDNSVKKIFVDTPSNDLAVRP